MKHSITVAEQRKRQLQQEGNNANKFMFNRKSIPHMQIPVHVSIILTNKMAVKYMWSEKERVKEKIAGKRAYSLRSSS